jgi:hypothetical protein
MGKLWVDRIIEIAGGEVSDDADGPAVVVAHNDVERAMSEIFSIPLGVNITDGIFENPDNFAGVTSEGKISMMRFKTDQIESDGGQSCGLEFDDGVNKRRLTFVGSHLQVWGEVSLGVWELIFDHEAEIEGTLSGKVDAGPRVQAKDPPLYVIAVDTVGDGEEQRFTLVKDEVYETGRTEFIELADVSAAFQSLPWQDGPYNEDKIGWGVAIGADETILEPVKIADLSAGAYSFHLWRTPSVPLGSVGRLGNGNWSQIGPFEVSMWEPGGRFPELVGYNGVERATVRLPAGVYKVRAGFRMTSASHGLGKLMLRLVGNGFHIFPQDGLLSQEIPWKYVKQDVPRDDWWHDWWPEVNPRQPFIADADMGPTMIIVPNDGKIGFQMGCTHDTDVSIVGQLAVERVQ